MKIAVLTLVIGTNYKEAVQKALDSKEEYCKKNGYDFIIGDESIYDSSRPIAWSKIKLIQKYLDEYDYIFSSDADVVIMNDNIKLEEFINTYLIDDYKLLLTKDWQNLNTGNMILKNCKEIHTLLDDIYKQTKYINNGWWEQSAFIFLYNQTVSIQEYTKVLDDSHILNAYIVELPKYILPTNNQYRTSDFLIHLAGIDNITHLSNMINICLDIKHKEKNEGFNQYVTIKL